MRGSIAWLVLVACATSGKVVHKECTDSSTCVQAMPRCSPDTFSCTGCQGDLDCAGYPSTPHCAFAGGCVACTDSTQCANPAPVCDATTTACRGCTSDDECLSRVCDVAAGTCVSQDSILYASSTGTDTAGCLVTSPCSLAHALSLVYPLRATVRMLPGTYADVIQVAGTTPLAISIVATGATIVGAPTGANRGIVVDNANDVTIRGLKIAVAAAGTSADVFCHGPPGQVSKLALHQVIMTTGSLATQNCGLSLAQADLRGVDIQLDDGTAADIARSKLSVLKPYSSSTFSLHVTNSLLTTIDLTLLTRPANADVYVAYNTFYGAVESCAGTNLPTGITFVDNIFVAPGMTDAIIGANCTFDTNVAFPQTTSVGIGTLKLDPKLANAGAGDYRLTATSPAVDAARATGKDPAVDFAGTARPQGAKFDIGAYEYKP